MRYIFIAIYSTLFLSMVFLGIYNFIFAKRAQIAEQKFGIHLPRLVEGFLAFNAFMSFLTALIFGFLLLLSLFALLAPKLY